MPKEVYTIIEKNYKGEPVVEILRNGLPWNDELPHAGRKHFSFGYSKARAILHAQKLITNFVETNGKEPGKLDPMSLGYVPNTRIRSLTVIKKGPFYNSKDFLVDHYYLNFHLSSNGRGQISFGLKKAEALLILIDDIKKFVSKYR